MVKNLFLLTLLLNVEFLLRADTYLLNTQDTFTRHNCTLDTNTNTVYCKAQFSSMRDLIFKDVFITERSMPYNVGLIGTYQVQNILIMPADEDKKIIPEPVQPETIRPQFRKYYVYQKR